MIVELGESQPCFPITIVLFNLFNKSIYDVFSYSNKLKMFWADMQRHKTNLEVQTCSCFSQSKLKINLKQELNIPALDKIGTTFL
jgi:hypothetical protein